MLFKKFHHEIHRAQYVLFSREGFTQAAKDLAGELNVRLVTLDEIEQTFWKVYQM